MEQRSSLSLALATAGVCVAGAAAVAWQHGRRQAGAREWGSSSTPARSSSGAAWLALLQRASSAGASDQQQQPQPAAVGAAAPVPQQAAALHCDWAQSHGEVLIEAALPQQYGPQDVAVKLSSSGGSLLVAVGAAGPPLLSGRLAGRVLPQGCSWRIEGKPPHRRLSISLAKAPSPCGQGFPPVWPSLLVQDDACAGRSPDQAATQQRVPKRQPQPEAPPLPPPPQQQQAAAA